MNDYGSDPVSAIAETEATGEVANIFADIRSTMEIPLLTSIWRSLVSVDGGLVATWAAAKPLYLTGQPEAALGRIMGRTTLPVLEPLVPGQLSCAGVLPEELSLVRGIIDAYNRSNGMNMVALTALVATPGSAPSSNEPPSSHSVWPTLPPLLAKADIDPETWTKLNEINCFGSVGNGGGLATLWRHLAHWPGFLAVIHTSLAPQHRNGKLVNAIGQVHELAQKEGASLANLRSNPVTFPTPARKMVENYVAIPGAVTRMVTIGRTLSRWLRTVPN